MAIRNGDGGNILAIRLVGSFLDSVDDLLQAGAMRGEIALTSISGVL
ncbi:hypothetical protein ACWGBH_11090 [Streptomyces massasporeus]